MHYSVIKELIPTNEAYKNMIKNIASSTKNKSKWFGKKWNVLGDSITYGYGTTKTYHDYIKEKLGIGVVNNYGISGTTIAYVDNPLCTQNNDIMCERYTRMTDDADVITVFGGVNDQGWRVPIGTMTDRTRDTFYGACHLLFKGLQEKYWDKPIGAITQLPRTNTTEFDEMLSQKEYVKAYKEVCAYYSIPCLDLLSDSGFKINNENFKTKYVPDGLHPNEEGHKLIVDRIIDFLEKL